MERKFGRFPIHSFSSLSPTADATVEVPLTACWDATKATDGPSNCITSSEYQQMIGLERRSRFRAFGGLNLSIHYSMDSILSSKEMLFFKPCLFSSLYFHIYLFHYLPFPSQHHHRKIKIFPCLQLRSTNTS